MSEREKFEAWMRDTHGPGVNLVRSDDGYISTVPHRAVRMTYASVQMLWEGWQAARAQPAQAGHVPEASCGECGKKASDGWALYCVACMEKAGLPAQAGPLLSDAEIDDAYEKARADYQRSRFAVRGQQLTAQDSPDWWFARAIEQAVRAKLGVAVPMTDEQITAISRQVAEGGPEDSIDRFVRAIERHHGIVGKDGA